MMYLAIFYLVMQAKADKANAMAEEILLNMEPKYVPPQKPKLDEVSAKRLEGILGQVESVVKSTADVVVDIKNLKGDGKP